MTVWSAPAASAHNVQLKLCKQAGTCRHMRKSGLSYVLCRADKYTCTGLDRLARDYLRRNFETVVKCDGRPPNRVGLVNLSQTALMQILTDDNLELSSEVGLT